MAADLENYPIPALDLVPIEKYRITPDIRTGLPYLN